MKKAKNKEFLTQSEQISQILTKKLIDNKAEDVIVIDLRSKSDVADYMIVATGTSDRHVGALANHLAKALKESGYNHSIEGLTKRDWVLVDAFDVVVHIFRREVRELYSLEKMWTA